MCVLTVSGAMDRVRATSLLERPWAIKKRISYGQKTKRAENSRLTIHHSVAVLKAPKARQIPVGLRNRPCFNQLAELRSTITRRRCVRLKSTWFASHRVREAVRGLGPSNLVSIRATRATGALPHLLASMSSVHVPQGDPCGTQSTANYFDFIGGYSRIPTCDPLIKRMPG
jgi:hypothetical protein